MTPKDIENYIKIENPQYDGSECETLKVIDVIESRGLKALFCQESKQITSFLFDKTQWTQSEAQKWVSEHAKSMVETYSSATIDKVRREKGKIIAVASEDAEDRHGETIDVEGWQLDNFRENPVLLWNHNMAERTLPIGRAENIRVRQIDGKKKLLFDPVFENHTDFGRTINTFIQEGVLNSFSVGFLPIEREGPRYLKQELLEISLVPVPALASARIIQRAQELGISHAKALDVIDYDPKIEEKKVVPYKKYNLAAESEKWDSKAAMSRMQRYCGGPDKDKVKMGEYKNMFAWYDEDDVSNFAAYKLPHHDAKDGSMVTVWKGVVAAMAALMGARGGVDVPESDRMAVYNHLARHYREFGKEPPEMKYIGSQEFKELFDAVQNEQELDDYHEVKKAVYAIRNEQREMKKQESDLTEALELLRKLTDNFAEKAKSIEKGGL